MKIVSELARNMLQKINLVNLVHFVADIGSWRQLEEPVLSSEIACPVCEGSDHYTPYVDPVAKDYRRVRICAKRNCEANVKRSSSEHKNIRPITRVQPWALFCEISGIGDIHYDVRFERIDQPEGKISYMLKFLKNPSGVLYMQGDPGTGKTYAAMGMCEYYTRKSKSCTFVTARQLFKKWLEVGDGVPNILNAELLVIDDFGTSEVSPAFMTFFMDLINSRLQWTNRGTVITTNLDDAKFSEFCGKPLADRIRTGQLFEFKGKSRRKNTPL